jgi:PPOX class probable FMN-dependent enzyme
MARGDVIETEGELAALYGSVNAASRRKEVPFIAPVYRRWIETSPFAVLATCGPDGLDASPRGDAPGFVVVENEHTLLLPERRGNNRIDSLRNIVADPRVALLFMIPGVGETLRVSGRARISVEPTLLARFAVQGKPPQCVLTIAVETVFFQCARAIQRAQLWAPAPDRAQIGVPTAGAILAALSGGELGGEAYDRELPQRQRQTLY